MMIDKKKIHQILAGHWILNMMFYVHSVVNMYTYWPWPNTMLSAPRLSGTNTRFVFMFLKWWACGVCNVFKAEYPLCLMLSIKSYIHSIAKYMICVCNNRILYYWFDYMVDFIVILVTISNFDHNTYAHTQNAHVCYVVTSYIITYV